MVPLLIGAAVLASGWGAKKGLDAKKDFDVANDYSDKARQLVDSATKKLDESRTNTNNSLELLGKTKLEIYEGSIRRFILEFEKIKNINLSEINIEGFSSLNKEEYFEMKKTTASMLEISGAGISSLGAGALAGLGAYGGAMTFAAASTGTAIGSLSGVAATNATLAWFGGGALSAGGLGMAGGAYVLGGVVAAPILLVAGVLASAKAEKARADAYSNLKEAEAFSASSKSIIRVSDTIGMIADEVEEILIKLNIYFQDYVSYLSAIVRRSPDYSTYSDADKNDVKIAMMLAKTLKNIMDFSLMDADGSPVYDVVMKAKQLEDEALKFLNRIQSV